MVVLEESTAVATKRRLKNSPWMRFLFAWRTRACFGKLESLFLGLFIVIAGLTLRYHEPWDDEAQAWLIACDNSVWQILRYRLHYEGAPPLWHLLLHLFHSMGGTYAGIGWISVLIAAAGMYVWLRWSPFPDILRYLLPFTFFFQYQYAVIARSYVCFPLLIFALCVLYSRRQSVLWFAFVAGLLANLSLQGFVVAVILIFLYLVDTYKQRALSKPPINTGGQYPRRRFIAAGILFGAMACGAIYCAIPAPDINFAIGGQVSTGTVRTILDKLIGETPRNAPMGPGEEIITGVKDDWVAPPWRTAPRAWLATLVYPRRPPTDHFAARALIQNVGPQLLDVVDAASWPIANSNLLAVAFLIAAMVWLRSRRCLRMLLPWLALLVTGVVLWTAEHHAGMLLIALVAGLWLAADPDRATSPMAWQAGKEAAEWPGESEVTQRYSTIQKERVFLGLFILVLMVQVAWTAVCVRAEVRGSYDPGSQMVKWLMTNPKPRVAAFGFPTVSTKPWFSHSPFFNVPTSWWQWSSNIEIGGIHRRILDTHPDAVVYGLEFPGDGQIRDQWLPITHISLADEMALPRDPIVRDLRAHGYRETHRFCGTRFARFNSAYRICDMVFEPAQ